jgi:FtsP/CotA-like multicopper oxidase with cupredoxin domain
MQRIDEHTQLLSGTSFKCFASPHKFKEFTMNSRRQFFKAAGIAGGAIAASAVNRVAMAALPEPVLQTRPDTMPPLVPDSGRPYNPVVTLNGWTLPWRMNQGVKEFHLVAEPVVREMAPGMKAHLWGYNGQSPGPTIEVVEGDRVRIFVTNKLPEHTSVHWHGQRLPNGMDGVSGLTQPAIQPGKTFVYEFVARRPGTFMYHPHADEMTQMAMGMMGFWVTHPKTKHPLIDDRAARFLLPAQCLRHRPRQLHAQDHDHARLQPVVLEQPHLSGHRLLNVRLNDKVRIRIGNLTMTNHPIHLHGHEFHGHRHGWRADAQKCPLARSHRRRCRGSDAPDRVCGR